MQTTEPVARRAITGVLPAGTPYSIEMLMTIAAVGTAALGAIREATVVVLLFLIGEWLEGVAADQHGHKLFLGSLTATRERAAIDAITTSRIQALNDEGKSVGALADADVGIAMGGGTDVALETGDAASLHGDLRDVGEMIAMNWLLR